MKLFISLVIMAFVLSTGLGLFLLKDNREQHPALITLPDNGDFTLYKGDVEIHLSDYKNKLVLIYFGYTSCPDICPTSLAFMREALKKLTEDELSKVQVLFVSVDPERDTAEKLRDYTAYFHPKILGITGTKADIDKVIKQYGASYKKVASHSAMGYTVDHTASFYMLTSQGQLIGLIAHESPIDKIIEAIQNGIRTVKNYQ